MTSDQQTVTHYSTWIVFHSSSSH